ncbi:N-acetylmuramoyl-L-alanine amidase [Clostridium perfringens]|uniref:N-acetylmuramoyl-L-alanine amidase n=1 Tax=Clostridium perfringens TaxID=1502 RepID=UPI00234028C2|nr:N-acetylmuramoyl-L-alanine amidase [Clostridium perfringens]MDC4245495.1 amidase [Clostridium perfringens]
MSVVMKYRFDNDDHWVGTNNPEYIVIHDTGNYDDTDEGNANYFCTGHRRASAHYFVDEDSITQVVREHDSAFHCGDGYDRYGIGNRNSIGIEMCKTKGDIAEQTIENTLWLVKDIQEKYNIPNDRVKRHYDASHKICPQTFSPNNWARWWDFKARLEGNEIPYVETIKKDNPSCFYESDITKTNATIVGEGNIQVLDDKCNPIEGRYISSLDKIFVLGIYPSSKFIEVIYPSGDKKYHAYISIDNYNRISFDYHMEYQNDDGDTYVWWSSENVNKTEYNEILTPNKKASPMYRENGWLRISFYREEGTPTDGYVRYEGEQSQKFYEESKIKQGVVKVNNYLNVRDDVKGDIIGKVFNNERVTIVWTETGWYYIEYDTSNGKKRGYVSAKYVEIK